MASSTIRASEIGSYLYCRRSWWYQRQGYPSANVRELARGSQAHASHGAGLRRLAWLRVLGFALIGLALLILLLQL